MAKARQYDVRGKPGLTITDRLTAQPHCAFCVLYFFLTALLDFLKSLYVHPKE
jgi:hypothetical protein